MPVAWTPRDASGPVPSFWSIPAGELIERLGTTAEGLAGNEAVTRRSRLRGDRLRPTHRPSALTLLLAQFKSPIILLLLFAATLADALGQRVDTAIILVIVLGSGLLGFWQERGAAAAVEALLARVRVHATVVRDGQSVDVPLEDVVSGDLVALSAGDVIPGDARLLSSRDLYVDEAALTGETYPVEKAPGTLPVATPLPQRSNCLFLGTHVVSGTARAVVVGTGAATEFGQVTQHIARGRPETEFEHGVRRFGFFLLEVTLLLVIAIFAINVYLARPVLESFLFSLALAVGLTPQLLPAIISVNLARGARRMADRKVIVKRLVSIENFGSMNVLCSDKTGTLTEGVVRVHSIEDFEGSPSDKARLFAYLNAHFETGFANPIDAAIRAQAAHDVSGFEKCDEVPYDFVRKRLSVVVETAGKRLLLSKGALSNVLEVCSRAETAGGRVLPVAEARATIDRRFAELGSQGYRVLGVAYRELDRDEAAGPPRESDMTFVGLLILHDPPKDEIAGTVARLGELGVTLKIITGDNRHVAEAVGQVIGLRSPTILTGPETRLMSDEALVRTAGRVEIFAEIEPNQKERILLALRKAGHVVGYLGDGINDASALRAADVGLSVDTAVDVAKEAADIVLLEKDLDVLTDGVREGRVTFANTLKYVYIATSANFGNMFSMAGASLFLSFLPLLPKQVLLLNLLTDLPEMAMATDRVDETFIARPRRWDIVSIRWFMVVFGTLSSVFDYATFGLLLALGVGAPAFRTGWFIESLVSACLVVLVIRTRKSFFTSRPGRTLAASTGLVIAATVALPYTPVATLMGMTPLPMRLVAALGTIVAAYVGAVELAKRRFVWR